MLDQGEHLKLGKILKTLTKSILQGTKWYYNSFIILLFVNYLTNKCKV